MLSIVLNRHFSQTQKCEKLTKNSDIKISLVEVVLEAFFCQFLHWVCASYQYIVLRIYIRKHLTATRHNNAWALKFIYDLWYDFSRLKFYFIFINHLQWFIGKVILWSFWLILIQLMFIEFKLMKTNVSNGRCINKC